MPSQFRWAWLLIMPGMIVPPVTTAPAGAPLPTEVILPAAMVTCPSSITPPVIGMTRPASVMSAKGTSNIGLVIFW